MPILGCASKSKNGLQSSSGSGISKATTPAPFNNPKYRELVREIEEAGGTAPVPGESDSAMAKVGSSVKKATSSLASALTMKPKVIKAPDPLSLDNMPDEIHANVYYQAGQLAESKRNRAAAIAQYTKALEVNPEYVPALISLARLYDRADEYDQAQHYYRKALEVDPENATAYNDLGLCLARNDRDAESVEALQHAVSLEPNKKLYRNNLATVLVDMGRVDEAWNELVGAHTPAEAHYNLGFLLNEKGDKEQARRHFALACQNDPTLIVAKEMLAQLGGESVGQQGRVRYRVDDMMAETRSGGTRANPAAMVLSPRELRRIPPTDLPNDNDPPRPPSMQLRGPVPVSPQAPLGAPVEPVNPQSDHQRQSTSETETMVQGEDDTELPTPALLREIAQN